MMKYSLQFILLISIGLTAISVDRVSCGALDKIKDLVTGGDKEPEIDEKNLTTEQLVEKQDKESLYQGGLKEQIAHGAADAIFDRATDYIKENSVPSILKPAVGLVTSKLKQKVHHNINSWDDADQIEKLEKERGENGEEVAEQREQENGENADHEKEHKEGWFEKVKDKITGHDDEHERRKRSIEMEPVQARQSKFSKLITNAKNLLHFRRNRHPQAAAQPRAYEEPQLVQQRRKRDVKRASENDEQNSAIDEISNKAKSVVTSLHPRNVLGRINKHLGNITNKSQQ